MTRKQALAELIAKVDAGTLIPDNLIVSPEVSAMIDLAVNVSDLHGDVWADLCNAYDGSLDAAKALHDAVLPDGEGWEVYRTGKYPGMIPGSSPYKFAARVGYGTTFNGDSDNPARAWLLATLRALHAAEPSE